MSGGKGIGAGRKAERPVIVSDDTGRAWAIKANGWNPYLRLDEGNSTESVNFKIESEELREEFDAYIEDVMNSQLSHDEPGLDDKAVQAELDAIEVEVQDAIAADIDKQFEALIAQRAEEHRARKDAEDVLSIRWRKSAVMGAAQSLASLTKFVPAKTDVADTVLLFVCKPDDAEAAVGDLIESFDVVRARHSAIVSNIWFGWELSWLVLAKGKQRIVRSALGPLINKWIGPS